VTVAIDGVEYDSTTETELGTYDETDGDDHDGDETYDGVLETADEAETDETNDWTSTDETV